MLKDLIIKNRSYRRFDQSYKIDESTLVDLIDHARFSSTGRNLQPLKYILVYNEKTCEDVFSHLAWAGYLHDWHGPVEGERPTGYIIMIGDTDISKKFDVDLGIAAQSIMLAATEKNLGGCMIASMNKEKLRLIFNLPYRYEVLLTLALGKPKETVKLTEIKEDGDIKYYRDNNEVHYVPKRTLNDLIYKY